MVIHRVFPQFPQFWPLLNVDKEKARRDGLFKSLHNYYISITQNFQQPPVKT